MTIIEEFPVCCAVPKRTICTVNIPWHESCSNLLSNDVIAHLFTFISFFVIFINLVSIVIQVQKVKGKTSFAFSVISLNVVDISLGGSSVIYCVLLIIIMKIPFITQYGDQGLFILLFIPWSLILTFHLPLFFHLLHCLDYWLSSFQWMPMWRKLNSLSKSWLVSCLFQLFYLFQWQCLQKPFISNFLWTCVHFFVTQLIQ